MVKEVLTSPGDKGALVVDLENQPKGKTDLNIGEVLGSKEGGFLGWKGKLDVLKKKSTRFQITRGHPSFIYGKQRCKCDRA